MTAASGVGWRSSRARYGTEMHPAAIHYERATLLIHIYVPDTSVFLANIVKLYAGYMERA